MDTTWEKLSLNEKKLFNEIAKKHQVWAQVVFQLKQQGCFRCGKKYPTFQEVSHHIYSTHGIQLDFLVPILQDIRG